MSDFADTSDFVDGANFGADAFVLLLSPHAKAARLAGQVLGRWKLEEQLPHGEGGFGVVYRASHVQPEMGFAAVKVFCFELNDDPVRRATFEKEVTVLKRITDADEAPRLVKIYDTGVHEESLPWIAMSYIKGESLATRLQRLAREKRFMGARDVVSVLCDVLRALQGLSAAHRGAAVVHRDIKPSNVMIEAGDGVARARLIDFGISRVFDIEKAPSSQAGYTRDMFTAVYGSPEMRAGWRKSTDARSDIFQVGLLGYEMLTGRRYWDDEGSLWARCGQYPHFLVKAVKRALDWDRERRFPETQSFINALKRPIRSRVSTETIRRHPEMVASASVCAILIAMLGGTAWGWRGARLAIGGLQAKLTNIESKPPPVPGKDPAPPPSTTLSARPDTQEQWGRVTRIRELHKKLYEGSINDTEFADLKRHCGQYLSATYFDQSTVDKVSQLRAWILAAEKGHIGVTIWQFDNEKYWFSWRLGYVIDAPGAHIVSDGVAVKGKVDTKMKPAWVKWGVSDSVTITISEMDKHYKGLVTRRLQEPAILHDLPANWQELTTDQDKGLKLWYTIERQDFGPLPPPF